MWVRALASIAIALLLSCASAYAQKGSIRGSVHDSATHDPVIRASVSLHSLAADGLVVGGYTTASGDFLIDDIPAGDYMVVISSVGYRKLEGQQVKIGGSPVVIDAKLRAQDVSLNETVVTASRKGEKALDAPASVSVIEMRQIAQTTALTPVDHLKGIAGVDIAQKGLVQTEVVTRGFSNVFSGSLMMLTDGRLSGVPSLRANLPYLIPIVNDDIEHIELVRGPGSALYGPNAASGVLNIITKSPLASPGTSIELTGGTQDLVQAQIRHAGTVGERFGYKISALYMRGLDWTMIDPVEAIARKTELDSGANPATLLVGKRDSIIERAGAEARFDYVFSDKTSLRLSAGFNEAMRNIELTDLGAVQGRNWRYYYVQTRFELDRFSAQAFINSSNAGGTYVLRSGMPIVDHSMQIVGRVQHSAPIGEIEELTYGGDVQLTRPATDGTINGRFEDDDDITELGAYLQSETQLLDRKLELIVAGRIDNNNRIDGMIFSPRAALAYKPAEDHQLRFTFNEAFSTPSTNDLFLDVLSTKDAFGFGEQMGTGVRLAGVPKDGYHFEADNTGGFYFHSPFADRAQKIPMAGVTGLWPAATGVVLAGLARDTSIAPGDLAMIQQLLGAIGAPNPGDIKPLLRLLNATDGTFSEIRSPQDIAGLKPTRTRTLELGYKGVAAEGLQLGVDVYWSHIRDFIGPMLVFTPNVFLDAASTAAWMQPRVIAAMMASGMPQAQAEAMAAQLVPKLAAGYTQVPLGTVSPQGVPDPTAILLSSMNYGAVDVQGVDLSLDYRLGEQWSISGSGSWVNYDTSNNAPPLNAPTLKWSLGGTFHDEELGLNASARVRHINDFDMESGVYLGEVPAYTMLDATVGYRIPGFRNLELTLSALNLVSLGGKPLETKHLEFVGAPEIGRSVSLRAGYRF